MDIITGKKDSEIDIYLAEYNNLWQEIVSRFDGQKQILILQIAVVGASVSGVAFFQTQPILYLFGALLLGLLSCVMMEQTVRINIMGVYIRTVLTPKVQSFLPGHKLNIWEWNSWAIAANPNNVSWGLLSLIKFIIGPFIVILLCVFFLTAKPFGSSWSSTEIILFISNVVILLFPVIIGTFILLRYIANPGKRNQKLHSETNVAWNNK